MSDEVTKKDLLELEIKITAAAKDDRHEWKNKLSSHAFNLDEYKTDQALIKLSQKTMQDNIQEIKDDMKEGFKDMKNFMKDLPNHFATKEEHRSNSDKIERVSNILSKIAWSIVWTIGTAILLWILKVIWLI